MQILIMVIIFPVVNNDPVLAFFLLVMKSVFLRCFFFIFKNHVKYFCQQRAPTITTCCFKMQTNNAAPFQDVNQMCMLEQFRVLYVVLCVYFCHYSYISELKVFSWYTWFRT